MGCVYDIILYVHSVGVVAYVALYDTLFANARLGVDNI